MLKGKQLVLATREFTGELRSKSWMHLLVTLTLLVVAWAIVFLADSLMLQFSASLFISLLLVRMFMLYHDYQHSAILRKSAIASAFFTLYGMFVLAPASIWKRSHNYHHANNSKLYTSSIGSYPILTKQRFLNSSKADQRLYLFTRHPLTIAFGYVFTFIWGMSFLSFISNPQKHWDSAIALLLHFSVSLLIYLQFGFPTYFFAMLLPFLIASAIGSYLFYAQHNFPSARFTDKEGWTYAGAALNSSSYMQGGPVFHWFTANIGYHHIHHTNARIPFYRLPEVYQEFPEFHTSHVTSLSPRDIAACLRMKVWDPDLGRMLTGAELRACSNTASRLVTESEQ